jgi:CO/xanthine dehydrogenase Mo-binding subunit
MIGRSVRRIDGVAKVTGEAVYGIDHEEPRMLHGSTSPRPRQCRVCTPSSRQPMQWAEQAG